MKKLILLIVLPILLNANINPNVYKNEKFEDAVNVINALNKIDEEDEKRKHQKRKRELELKNRPKKSEAQKQAEEAQKKEQTDIRQKLISYKARLKKEKNNIQLFDYIYSYSESKIGDKKFVTVDGGTVKKIIDKLNNNNRKKMIIDQTITLINDALKFKSRKEVNRKESMIESNYLSLVGLRKSSTIAGNQLQYKDIGMITVDNGALLDSSIYLKIQKNKLKIYIQN